MTEEEYIKEAERRYPIGTEYIPLKVDGYGCEDVTIAKKDPVFYDDETKSIEVGYGWVHTHGKWARRVGELAIVELDYEIY